MKEYNVRVDILKEKQLRKDKMNGGKNHRTADRNSGRT